MTPQPHRAQWMSDGVLGMMVHYIVGPKGETDAEKTADFNRTVDAFPLDEFVQRFEASGANWLIFTYGQCTGYYCGPNALFDEVLPGHTSDRHLMKEIGDRIHAMGKRLIAYLPGGFALDIPGHPFTGKRRDGTHDPDFVDLYSRWIADYSVGLGRSFDGWWIDGILDQLSRYETDWAAFCDACRAGNPDAAVGLNDDTFCNGIIAPLTPHEDFLSGEVEVLEDAMIQLGHLKTDPYQNDEGKWRMRGQPPLPLYMPETQYVDGVQWHVLAPLDGAFQAMPPHEYGDDELVRFVRACKAVGGAVTFNLPFSQEALMPEKTLSQFARLSAAVHQG